jgi:hypothetical protein
MRPRSSREASVSGPTLHLRLHAAGVDRARQVCCMFCGGWSSSPCNHGNLVTPTHVLGEFEFLFSARRSAGEAILRMEPPRRLLRAAGSGGLCALVTCAARQDHPWPTRDHAAYPSRQPDAQLVLWNESPCLLQVGSSLHGTCCARALSVTYLCGRNRWPCAQPPSAKPPACELGHCKRGVALCCECASASGRCGVACSGPRRAARRRRAAPAGAT